MAITLDDIKKLTTLQRILLIVVFYLLCGYFFYFYFLQTDLEKRADLQSKLEDLEQQVATKERLANELDKYLKDVDSLQLSFTTALTKLPVREEIPELLRNVALSGTNAGMSFQLFEPKASIKKQIGGSESGPPSAPQQTTPNQPPASDKGTAAPPAAEGEYYEEIPVRIIITGSYYKTVAFFSKVAALPRIINIEDIEMGNAKIGDPESKNGNDDPLLKVSCLLKTYMFIQKPGGSGK